MLRRFYLERDEDVNGKSGTGRVAEGVEFENGLVAYSWLSPIATATIAPSISSVEKLHSHGGIASNCRIVWVDELHDDLEQRAKKLKTKKLKELMESEEDLEEEEVEETDTSDPKEAEEETPSTDPEN